MKLAKIALISSLFLLFSCMEKPKELVKIGINPWPGYEYLYLAENQGFFEELGMPVKIIQLSSLSDVRRAYLGGRVDGMASTMIEVVQASQLGNRPLKVVLVSDYSNGGDVIIAHKSISSMAGLQGKTIGLELASLGVFFLHRALNKVGLSLADVTTVNIEQTAAAEALLSETIDAYVTYPPTSIHLLKKDRFHSVFSSADIPFEIIDTVTLSTSVLEREPGIVAGLHQAWQMALDFAKDHPQEASRIMAQREGISVEDFDEAVLDLVILDTPSQREIFANADELQRSAQEVCQVLADIKSLESSCDSLPNVIYRAVTAP